MAGDFHQSHLSHNRRREMINELDRLMTITDLLEMLGVPVAPYMDGGTAVRAGRLQSRSSRSIPQGSRRGLA
jgi:hypothetical protein